MNLEITKCDATLKDETLCPLCKKCYRYTSIPDNYYQSYFAEAPYKDKDCEYYISTTLKGKK